MTFFNGNTDLDTLLNLWVNELIATGSWVDNDLTWNGTRRSLRHAVDAGVFIAFERRTTTDLISPPNGFNQRLNFQWLEIRVIFSTGWVANAPSGTLRYSGMVVNSLANTNQTGQHWTWIDANGFITLHRPTASASGIDETAFVSLQRLTTKEYADGATNMYWTSFSNNSFSQSGNPGSGTVSRYYHQDPSLGAGTEADSRNRFSQLHLFTQQNFLTASANPGVGCEMWFAAYRSPGNSKVYFAYPYFFNTSGALAGQRNPITVAGDIWFQASQALGIADGDIVDYTAPGPILKRYLVKTLDSPDSVGQLNIGIRFA
jgi:hypothetical protein